MPILAQERRIELCVENKRAATEGWFGAELLQHQLLDRVVEDTKTRTDTGLPRASKKLAQEAVFRIRAPCQPNSRSKRFVIGLRQSVWNALVARNN